MPCCAKCEKTCDDEAQMRKCCEGTYYCNRKCERANFQHHKVSCPKLVPETKETKKAKPKKKRAKKNKKSKARKFPSAPLIKQIQKPFDRLKKGNYLQGRPDTDVYRLIIDAYRLRMEDNYTYADICYEDSIYGGAKDGLEGFRVFLQRAKEIPLMMPSWWNDKKQAECEELGRQHGWSSLAEKINDASVRGHYEDKLIDIQLRMLAEDIYGTGIGDERARFLRDEIMKSPDSTNIHVWALLCVALSRHLLQLAIKRKDAMDEDLFIRLIASILTDEKLRLAMRL
ncbi:hypothetical protein EKO27_g1998 [Xylaria grammica]|uniref:MYND-type domain-containing protein n=1 Tax=Xylaria grammica TaxID=363999 RepID=A0A439DFD7_9PEZI|nr:hypothetical protein EKO27_g1998 [Xylaria grammica]